MANKTMTTLTFDMSGDTYEITDEAARNDISELKSRKINGKPLSQDITLVATDIGAAESDHTHDVATLGAASETHTHTLAELGAAADEHTHSASDVGAAAEDHTHTAKQVSALAMIDASNMDMDTILQSGEHIGMYVANSTTSNTPYTDELTVAFASFGILSLGSSANNAMQIAFSAGFDKIFFRTRGNGTTSQWQSLMTNDSIEYSESQPAYSTGKIWLKPIS